jgi:hypothetical protein
MFLEGGAKEPDALETFQELYGDLGDESMGTSEPPRSP